MKNIFISFSLLLFLSACNNTNNNTGKNVELIENYIKAVEHMDFDAMDKYLADNYQGFGPSYNDSVNKQIAITNWKNNVENLYKSIHYKRSKVVSVHIPDGPNKGEWVVSWAELLIHYKNNTDSVTIFANTNYMVENDKIIRSYTVYNEADALRQLGFEFLPPGKGN